MKSSITSVFAPAALALIVALDGGAQTAASEGSKAGTPAPVVHLHRGSVSATGRQSALLTVSQFGRYAIRAKSAQGIGVQLVDRMAGPGEVSGVAGESDGRIDAFLDRGQYRVVTHGHPRAKGEARLEAIAFAERHAPQPPLLPEHRLVEETLDDLQQASWWIEVREDRFHSFEAAGRNLADLRLWKDGTWLVDAAPVATTAQPKEGQPLRNCRLTARLEPGLYLLVAYGGPPQPWSEGDGHPLYVRSGIPKLPEAGRERMRISPFGTDFFLVDGAATYFRLELPEAREASMEVGSFGDGASLSVSGSTRRITKESRVPAVEVDRAASESGHLVTVSGAAGQPFVLQHFVARDLHLLPRFAGGVPLPRDAAYWVSTIHAGDPRDAVDATGVVVQGNAGGARYIEAASSSGIVLDGHTGWARRANVLGAITLFLQVREPGEYELWFSGPALQGKIEPLLVSTPAGYSSPDFRGSGSLWNLDSGWNVLTVMPAGGGGVATIRIRPKALPMVPVEQPRGGVRFSELRLAPATNAWLTVGEQGGVRTGLVLRRLPLDLTAALPLTLSPGDAVTTQFRAAEAGSLRAQTEDGAQLDVLVDGAPIAADAPIAAGTHTVGVVYKGTETTNASLWFVPSRLDPRTPLPPLPDAALASLPKLPAIAKDEPHYLDVDRGKASTVLVKAAAPGLYRLESTGLLATSGDLRTRTVTSFAHAEENGVGRNFQIGAYLREGDYQLTVAPRGETAGHLGLAITPTKLADGGFLTSRRPARATLAAGEGIAYRFTITKPGEFRLRSIGLGRTFRYRLEDLDGWPVVTPGIDSELTRWFDPGRYRLIVLPESTEARVLTVIEPVTSPRSYRGHGPHALPLGTRVTHLWTEPAGDAERTPDAWRFELPASTAVTIELTGEMEGTLIREAETPETVGTLPPGRGFEGMLRAGRYRIDASCSRRNHLAQYAVAVWPRALVAGTEREIAAPAEVDVAVGRTGLVEIASFGAEDVKARLLDESGRVVATSDDRTDDWNFALAATVTEGNYRLRVDPVAGTSATTRISLREPRELVQTPFSVPGGADVQPQRDVHVYPLTLAPEGDLLLLSARSAESIGLGLESAVSAEGPWRSVGTATGRTARLFVQRDHARTYRVRIWSIDRRDSPIRLTIATSTPAPLAGNAVSVGVVLTQVEEIKPLRTASVETGEPGVFRIDAASENVWLCGAPDQLCTRSPYGTIATSGSVLSLVSDSVDRVQLARVRIGEAAVILPEAGRAVADVEERSGPMLVEAVAPAGQPGVAIGERADAVTIVGERTAATLDLEGGAKQVRVWSADADDPAAAVRLSVQRFSAEAVEARPFGTHQGTASRGRAVAFDLPGGAKWIRIALASGMLAALSNGTSVTSLVGSDHEARSFETISGATRLTILARDSDVPYSFEISPAVDAGLVSEGTSYRAPQASAGVLRLPIVAEGKATLHVRGASDDPVLITRDGRVLRGRDLELDGGSATLMVPHDASLVLVWLAAAGSGDSPWSRAAAETQPVELPLRRRLSGGPVAVSFELAALSMLHVRTTAPVATIVRRAGAAPEIELHPSGAAFDTPAEGRIELELRSPDDEPLTGVVEVTVSKIVDVAEGLGPEVLLAPGATRGFAFRVARPGPIGAAVRADVESVEMTLHDEHGRVIGRGVSQMPVLEPGTYVLALHAPAGGAPVAVRTALVGLDTPPVTPPADVIERYRAGEEAPVAFSSRRVESAYYEGEMAEDELEEPSADEGAWDGSEEPSEDEAEESSEEAEPAPGSGGMR